MSAFFIVESAYIDYITIIKVCRYSRLNRDKQRHTDHALDMPRQQSKIWTFYTKTNNITAKCKQCFKEIKHCRNTTNLFKHASTHKIVVNVQQGKQKKKVADKTGNRYPMYSIFWSINSFCL